MSKKLLALIAFIFHRLVSLTWRVRLIIPEEMSAALKSNTPIALAHWHGEQSGLVLCIKKLRASIMTSLSDDGEIMTRFVELYGAKTSRGSSSRGAVGALKGMLRLAQKGYNPAVSVDGPRGPFHSVKPGIFEISRILSAPIFPGVVVVSSAWPLKKTWDKSFFPKPFAQVIIFWDAPMDAIAKSKDSRDEALARELSHRFDLAREKALKYIVE